MKYYETDKIELKERITEDLPKEIESFLNSEGGLVYIGVDKSGTPIGVSNIDEKLRQISDIASDKIEPNAIDCVRPEVEFDEDKPLIKINIKKGNNSLYCIKKYGFSSNGCHFRIGSSCKSMNLETIKERFELGLVDSDLMLKKESYYQDLRFSIFKMLLLENGYHLDESTYERNFKLRTKEGKYNYLAELLADRNFLPFVFTKFKGKTKAAFSERNDYGNQCLIVSYEKMKERLQTENICKTITNPRPRRDIYLFDMDAVNEALANALVHNDYRISEPQVSFFSDHLEILSHGGLPFGLSKEEFFRGVSRPRNAQLMDVFTRFRIVEHTGHGIPTIVKKYGKDAFIIGGSSISVIIPFSKEVKLIKNDVPDRVTDVPDGHVVVPDDVPDRVTDVPDGHVVVPDNVPTLTSRAKNMKILESKELNLFDEIKKNPRLDIKEYSRLLNVTSRSIKRYLSLLKHKGYIERYGTNKNGYWKIKK